MAREAEPRFGSYGPCRGIRSADRADARQIAVPTERGPLADVDADLTIVTVVVEQTQLDRSAFSENNEKFVPSPS